MRDTELLREMTEIPNPVILKFDPKETCEDLQTIFDDYICRTLWMSWRVGHIVDQYFNFHCFASAERLKIVPPPIIVSDLIKCVHGGCFSHAFGNRDIRRWAPLAVGFFNYEPELKYEVRK